MKTEKEKKLLEKFKIEELERRFEFSSWNNFSKNMGKSSPGSSH
ncbi:hypothetical protein [Flavobacterium sp. N502540]|nr:hypothetical protein [Flavobacterium sp. N502540]